MTLTDVAREEEALIQEVLGSTGTMEQLLLHVTQTGIATRYAAVHRMYVAISSEGDTEALKRVLFLQWYAAVEPPSFTGLAEIDPEAEAQLLEQLALPCERDQVEQELREMLAWYDFIADWYFEQIAGPDKSRSIRRESRRTWKMDRRRVGQVRPSHTRAAR